MRFILCTWFGEFCSCCSLIALPGPAWVLLNWICKELISSLYVLWSCSIKLFCSVGLSRVAECCMHVRRECQTPDSRHTQFERDRRRGAKVCPGATEGEREREGKKLPVEIGKKVSIQYFTIRTTTAPAKPWLWIELSQRWRVGGRHSSSSDAPF